MSLAKSALSTMKNKSGSIWDTTLKNNESSLDEMITLTKTLYEWKNFFSNQNLEASSLVNEALLDLFGSINSIMNGYYRQGMFSLRSCLEMIIDFVYYVDHPVEYKMWRIGTKRDNDARPSFWVSTGLLHKSYVKLFVPSNKTSNGLDQKFHSVYAQLSKFIHAQRINTMQIGKTSELKYDRVRFNVSKSNFKNTCKVANTALAIRFYKEFKRDKTLKSAVWPHINRMNIIKI